MPSRPVSKLRKRIRNLIILIIILTLTNSQAGAFAQALGLFLAQLEGYNGDVSALPVGLQAKADAVDDWYSTADTGDPDSFAPCSASSTPPENFCSKGNTFCVL